MNTHPIAPTYTNQGVQSTLSPTTGTTGTAEPDFKSLMTALILGMSSSSDTGQTGSSMSAMMAPLILSMLEKLLSSQANSQPSLTTIAPQTITATAPKTAAAKTSPDMGISKGSHNTPSGRPVGGVITQMPHTGHMAIDMAVPVGTDVHATMNGKVIYAGWNDQGYGNLVIVENGPYKTYFAHLSKVPVSLGDQVNAGEVVGISGSTGNSTGPHVHYEVRLNNVAIDPSSFTLNK